MIDKYLGRYSGEIYAILRIVVGFLFLLHGTEKLFGFARADVLRTPLDAVMTTAGVIEIVAGLMILVGLFASIAAFIASGEMAVGYFMVHQPMGALPIQNGGEVAVLFCFIFLYIAAYGSGIWSLDSLLVRRNPSTRDPRVER